MPTDLDLDAGDVPDGPTSLDDSRPPSGPISRVDWRVGASSSLSTATAEPPSWLAPRLPPPQPPPTTAAPAPTASTSRASAGGHQAEGLHGARQSLRAVLPGTVAPGMKASGRPTHPRRSARAGARRARRRRRRRGAAAAAAARRGGGAVRRPGRPRATTTAGRASSWTSAVRGPLIRRKSCVFSGRGASPWRRRRRHRRRRRLVVGAAVAAAGAAPRRRAYLGDGHRPVDESSPAKLTRARRRPPAAGGVTPSALMLQTPELELLAGGISPSRRLRI